MDGFEEHKHNFITFCKVLEAEGSDISNQKENCALYYDLLKIKFDSFDDILSSTVKKTFIAELPVLHGQPTAYVLKDYGFPIIFFQKSLYKLIKLNSMLVELLMNYKTKNIVCSLSDAEKLIAETQNKLGSYFYICFGDNKLNSSFILGHLFNLESETLFTPRFYGGVNDFIDNHQSLGLSEDELIKKMFVQILFVLFHELGHYILQHEASGVRSVRSLAENKCNHGINEYDHKLEFEADLFALSCLHKYYADINIEYCFDLFLLFSYGDSRNSAGSHSHPSAINRLKNLYNYTRENLSEECCDHLSRIMNHINCSLLHANANNIESSVKLKHDLFNHTTSLREK